MKLHHRFTIDEETSAQLEALLAKPGTSKSAVISDAIRHFIRYRAAHALDESLRIRLDRLAHDNDLIRRDINVLIESLAFFVRLFLTLNAHTPIPTKEMQKIARDRYQEFVKQVDRQVAARKRSLGPKVRQGEEQAGEERVETSHRGFEENTEQSHTEGQS